MASIASLVRGSDGYMKFIDYTSTYKDGNREFLRSDMWQLFFLNPPKIVYYPGDDLINARLNGVQVGLDYSVNGFEKRMRGNYVIHQRTGQQTNGTITMNFVDREDQAITYFADDWRQKIADRETKYTFRKDDTVADLRLVITNAQRLEVRVLEFYNCIIQDAPLNENGDAEDGGDRADISITCTFEHHSRSFSNL